jgi:hypothetical protein
MLRADPRSSPRLENRDVPGRQKVPQHLAYRRKVVGGLLIRLYHSLGRFNGTSCFQSRGLRSDFS